MKLHLQKVDPAGAETRAKRWAEENAATLEGHRRRVERDGVFGEDFRTW